MIGQLLPGDGDQTLLRRIERALGIQDAESAVNTLVVKSSGEAVGCCSGIKQGLLSR